MNLTAYLLVSCLLIVTTASAQDKLVEAEAIGSDIAKGKNTKNMILKNPERISAASLAKIKLLELGVQARDFKEAEIKTVLAFVRNGGALLVMIDEERRTKLLKNGANSILSEFGMEFTADIDYLHNCGALAKAGVINAADREVAYSGGRGVKGGAPFAWRLDKKGSPAEAYAAYVELENGGRVVALAEGMANLGLGTAEGERLSGVPRNPRKTTYWGKDSKLFMQEIRNWLLKKENKRSKATASSGSSDSLSTRPETTNAAQ